jgi:hypothetical protein
MFNFTRWCSGGSGCSRPVVFQVGLGLQHDNSHECGRRRLSECSSISSYPRIDLDACRKYIDMRNTQLKSSLNNLHQSIHLKHDKTVYVQHICSHPHRLPSSTPTPTPTRPQPLEYPQWNFRSFSIGDAITSRARMSSESPALNRLCHQESVPYPANRRIIIPFARARVWKEHIRNSRLLIRNSRR